MKAQISKVPIAIEVWKRGRATNEDLTFRAAGVMASVGLSHVKTSGREKDHETNKFLANCHRRADADGRGERPFGNKEREDDFGHRCDEERALEVLS